MEITELRIDPNEIFPALPNAPIVEAALGIEARAETSWNESTVSQTIKSALPDYPKVASHNRIVHSLKLQPIGNPQSTTQDIGWMGFRLESETKPQIAQFNRDGFLFSRLRPYETWNDFVREARRLWEFYVSLAKPTEIQRISLRYINRIELPPKEANFEHYIQPAPETPHQLDVPFYGFFHQDMLAVPGHDYSLNVIRTIQPPADFTTQGFGLILDITVMSVQPFTLNPSSLDKRLPEMRWLKNKVFYGSVTEKALNSFKC